MATLGELVEVNEFWVRLLRPTLRCRIEFVGEDAHGNRDGDAFRVEVPFAPILPIKTSARKCGVRQPGDGDVVEDVIAREAFGFSREDARDELIAAGVVVKEISRQADGR